MAELRWTPEALDWLEDIHRYIAQDNPQAAVNVIDGILQKADVLTAFSRHRHAPAHRAGGRG